MPKGQFNALQVEHLNTYLLEYITKLDAGIRGVELTQWKQATATKALALPEFADLDVSKHSWSKWFEVHVSDAWYTNYLHQVYNKTHPEIPSASSIIKANLLLKFSSTLSGPQLFSQDMREEIVRASKQHALDKGNNDAATYQHVLKSMWDALTSEERSERDAKAEDECGDIAV
ncbi:hypothetical protein B0H10DRAFT_1942035 [Mycena sp. CBHHK59/15]|nr:hypothetical protein B0H10DRAFT_1942035 [Mycena sp. CBHHK59/15]